MDHKYDFSGWATRNDLVCADGRTIRKDAFKHCDGKTVPLVWNHRHDEPANILGHALLENREDGVYAYCSFNDTESGRAAKELVQHGDVESLSIYANGLKQTSNKDVMHGDIKEVSLVVAGANPGAFIDFVDMAHAEEGTEEEVIIGTGEGISMYHAEEKSLTHAKCDDEKKEDKPSEKKDDEIEHSKEPEKKESDPEKKEEPKKQDADPDKKDEPEKKDEKDPEEETIQDVFNTLNDKQKTVVYAMLTAALGESSEDGDEKKDDPDKKSDKSEGGQNTMKHNVFEKEDKKDTVLSHSDCQDIIALAKSNSVGSLRTAMNIFAEQNDMGDELKHGIDNIENLFPDYKDLRPGAPEKVTRDQGWVNIVMQKVHKSPISRIRTRQMDTRVDTLRAKGYKRGAQKTVSGNMKAISRTTDPQTVYITDALHRDDIIDITDFDVVAYQYETMRETLNEEVATAIMIGDGRGDSDPDKISEDHIRSIWKDDDTYTIHYDVDIEAAREELNGTNTGASFGANYIYAEAIITAALYAREKYKGTGTPDFFCTPHLVNVMLLARDMNGRRIYNSKTDLAAALNVGNLYTAEQFEGLIRTDDDGDKHKLLGLFVNLADYTVGSTKGGEITRFNQFDIDFNKEKYLIETRLSGALTRIYSAIALEEPVENP